jgi:hypothetical protein
VETEDAEIEVDAMEEENEALCWVRANPMQESSVDE